MKGYERAAPAGHESQLAYGSPVFVAGGIPISHRCQSLPDNPYATGEAEAQTPLDLRCVHRPRTYGLHDDHTPSLQLYDDGTWYCYGACQAGGSIFDFAARAWQIDAKGRTFLKLRARLADKLGVSAPG